MKTDNALQRDVLAELQWDPRVDHSHIGVAAKDGVVTLSGIVPSYAEKVAAEKAAQRVQGVKAIAEEIEVRFAFDPKSSDSEIAQRILAIFNWDVTIPHDRLKVKVEHGFVTITGNVEWNFQKKAAFKAASQVGGVKGVVNLIELAAKPTPDDVRDRILSAFQRTSLLDANSIDISVLGGTVKLGGRVRGWNERKIAEQAAWSAPGVTRVEDDMLLA